MSWDLLGTEVQTTNMEEKQQLEASFYDYNNVNKKLENQLQEDALSGVDVVQEFKRVELED